MAATKPFFLSPPDELHCNNLDTGALLEGTLIILYHEGDQRLSSHTWIFCLEWQKSNLQSEVGLNSIAWGCMRKARFSPQVDTALMNTLQHTHTQKKKENENPRSKNSRIKWKKTPLYLTEYNVERIAAWQGFANSNYLWLDNSTFIHFNHTADPFINTFSLG